MLGADWCARWFEGLPEYVDVPGQINVLEILRLWTYAKSLDLVGWGEDALQPARPGATIGFPARTPPKSRELDLRPLLQPQPVCETESRKSWKKRTGDYFEKPVKRLSKS